VVSGRPDAGLDLLLAERAIHRVILRYCRGVDRMDRDLVRSCYHADAIDSHGSWSGTVDEFLVWVWRVLGRYTMTMHFLGNVLIEVDPERPGAARAARSAGSAGSDRSARAETYGIAFHRTDNGPDTGNLTTGFRYVDDFALRPVEPGAPPEWRITRRMATTEWVRVDRPEDHWPIPEGMLRGSRDRTDPVYRNEG
jgi:hypothetical protein